MSYEPTVWQTGDTVTAEKLNKLENGVKALSEASEDLAGKMVALYKIGIRVNQGSAYIGLLDYFNYNEETGELTNRVTYDFSGLVQEINQYHSINEVQNNLYLMPPEWWKPQVKNTKLVFIPNSDLNFDTYIFGGDYEISSYDDGGDAPIPVVILTGTEFHVGVYVD